MADGEIVAINVREVVIALAIRDQKGEFFSKTALLKANNTDALFPGEEFAPYFDLLDPECKNHISYF